MEDKKDHPLGEKKVTALYYDLSLVIAGFT